MMKRRYILFMLLACMMSAPAHSQSVEYSVKASFIEKFARFTEWESNSIGEYFVIDILGNSPFGGEFERLAVKEKIKGRPIRVRYIKDYREARDCQVLFICRSEKENLREIVRALKHANILLVADSPGFSELGVHFNFYLKDNETIHFEVNPKALASAQLKPDLLLLSIGKIIN
jgi:hypothetical protein